MIIAPVFTEAPYPSAHAATLAETPSGLVCAWFAGSREGERDVAVWLARRVNGAWSAPACVVDGADSDGRRQPCWNPVLHAVPDGPLLLFYKVGPSPRRWWGMLMRSDDDGETWSAPERLPDGILGPIKNKPLALADGALLCPSSREDDGWRVHMERTPDLGQTWETTPPVNDGRAIAAIQPALLNHGSGRLQALCRSRRSGITECWSHDDGRTWGAMTPTPLPNPNSGFDAVTLADGRHLLVYNHSDRARYPLNVALSRTGRDWRMIRVLEDQPGEYSYPAVIQAGDGRVNIVYTWNRVRIHHGVLDPADVALTDVRGNGGHGRSAGRDGP